MPIKRRTNGQFAPDFSGKNNVPTAAPLVPTKNTLSAGGRAGAELRTKTYLSGLLGVSPDKIDTSGKQSIFSLRAAWFFNGVVKIGDERVQLRTRMFYGSEPRMNITLHEPGNNGRQLTESEIAAMRARLNG